MSYIVRPMSEDRLYYQHPVHALAEIVLLLLLCQGRIYHQRLFHQHSTYRHLHPIAAASIAPPALQSPDVTTPAPSTNTISAPTLSSENIPKSAHTLNETPSSNAPTNTTSSNFSNSPNTSPQTCHPFSLFPTPKDNVTARSQQEPAQPNNTIPSTNTTATPCMIS